MNISGHEYTGLTGPQGFKISSGSLVSWLAGEDAAAFQGFSICGSNSFVAAYTPPPSPAPSYPAASDGFVWETWWEILLGPVFTLLCMGAMVYLFVRHFRQRARQTNKTRVQVMRQHVSRGGGAVPRVPVPPPWPGQPLDPPLQVPVAGVRPVPMPVPVAVATPVPMAVATPVGLAPTGYPVEQHTVVSGYPL